MTIEREMEVEIRRLYFAEHWKRGTIAAQLGVHGDVVERVIGPLGPAPTSAEPRPGVLDPYRGFVLETLQRYPRLCATRIFDMVVERGYTGSLRTLRRFVLPHRPEPTREVYVRIETLAAVADRLGARRPHPRQGRRARAVLLRAALALLARDVGRAGA